MVIRLDWTWWRYSKIIGICLGEHLCE